MKSPKQTPLSLVIADIYRNPEPCSEPEGSELKVATPLADTSDFSEGQEDPAQSAELERQQDA